MGVGFDDHDWREADPLDNTTWPADDSVALGVLVAPGYRHRYDAGRVSHLLDGKLLAFGTTIRFGGKHEHWRLFWQPFPEPPIPELEG